MSSLPIYGETSHIWKVLPFMGSLPIYGKSSHVWEVWPYMGRLPICGKSSRISMEHLEQHAREASTHMLDWGRMCVDVFWAVFSMVPVSSDRLRGRTGVMRSRCAGGHQPGTRQGPTIPIIIIIMNLMIHGKSQNHQPHFEFPYTNIHKPRTHK
jgi:hypothetical protein